MSPPHGDTGQRDLSRPAGRRRWIVVGLLFAAVVISYIDRQTFGLLKGTISGEMHWTNSDYANVVLCFQGAYALSYLAFGRIVDRIGARLGLSAAFAVWSVAQVMTSLAGSFTGFATARIALGLGEAGAFPGAIKAIAIWFPRRERAFANGLFNAGANIGAIITPLLAPVITLAFGWRAAFVATGVLGLIWLPLWLIFFRRPREDRRLTAAELAWIEQDDVGQPEQVERVGWRALLGMRQTWAYAVGKALTDPVWGLFLNWLPDFLGKRFHMDLKAFGPPLVAIYLISDFGSVGGGWLSSSFLKRGWSLNRARKTTFLICGVCALPVAFAAHADNVWMAVAIIGLAAAAHQGFSATLYTLPADLIPRGGVASVVGLGGMLGTMGSMAMAKYTGWTLDHDRGYAPVFALAAGAYLAATLAIHLLTPKMQPARLPPA